MRKKGRRAPAPPMAHTPEQDTCSIDTTSSGGGGGEREGKAGGGFSVLSKKVMLSGAIVCCKMQMTMRRDGQIKRNLVSCIIA